MPVALYIDSKRGPYPGHVGQALTSALGVEHDARTYDGPLAVVAHPPCKDWGGFAHWALPDADRKSCGPRAVAQVRAFGGVLEHPARSRLWIECGLPRPGELPDSHGGWTLEVNQCDWGHPARKKTWLYIAGVAPHELPPIPPAREPTHVIAPSKTPQARAAARGRHIPKSQRHLTPPAFASWLIELATRVERNRSTHHVHI